jgi:hypothetical protein
MILGTSLRVSVLSALVKKSYIDLSGSIQEEKVMIAKRVSLSNCLLLIIAAMFILPMPVAAQGHGGGGGGGCGDVFGDLIHVLRADGTWEVDGLFPPSGQPILERRWVELPADAPGYGWGYCPIAVYHDEDGVQFEIPFLPNSCDFDPVFADLVEEVDYFGRLNGGRTKERNHRMHLDEVIANIRQADFVTKDETERLKLGFNCKFNPVGKVTGCYEWATVDSPMESMAFYARIMKYGHLATDPNEVDTWSHGDPKRPTQFHPALTPEDWDKFDEDLANLKPELFGDVADCYDYSQAELILDDEDGDGVWDPYEPFFDMGEPNCVRDEHEPFEDLDFDGEWYPGEPFVDSNGNCVRDEFVYLCAAPEHLDNEDFESGAVVLSAAASKTGWATRDLLQYVNRILKITKKTDHTEATLDTLPALVRDCWNYSDYPDPVLDAEFPLPVPGEGEPPLYLDPYTDGCVVTPATETLVNRDLFPDVKELFVDFSGFVNYSRANNSTDVLYEKKEGGKWEVSSDEPLMNWVEFVNGEDYIRFNIDAFVHALNDGIRTIEYVHNYSIPEDLYGKYDPDILK